MGSRIECFWLEPLELGRSDLRRYEKVDYAADPPPSCPSNRMKCHDTSVYIGDVEYLFGTEKLLGYGRDDISHDDPRWPTVCDWQHNVNRLFKGAPDGKLYTTRTMPPGAMFNADWWPTPGPDGIPLAVVLPPTGGDDIWYPDTPSKNGSPWTRKGTLPKVTCTPSILTPRYHGFLTDGWLIEC